MSILNLKEQLRIFSGKIIIPHLSTYYLKHVYSCTYFYKVTFILSNWLLEHPNNVVVTHCNAGKGRTGTIICCFLIFSGLAENAKDAITYYGWKRFTHGRGVT
jgi:protein-tyrosine phosphatase